ncbi:MAG TPA: WD40 repeat domain-containing protein, partial [Gemmataceae bacterium]|nr:WD40 repeat domain-containing protein [Gemmataceae bacterium]
AVVPAAAAPGLADQGGDRPPPPDEDKPKGTDRYGDPLPEGAIARMGTVRWRHAQWVRSLSFSPDGKLIASASSDHTIRLWDRASGREVRRLTGHQDAVNFVAFTADGKQLISASGYYIDVKDSSVRLWDVATGKEVRRFPQAPSGQPMAALVLSPDGKLLAAGCENSIALFEVPGGRRRGGCGLPTGRVKKVCFRPDGKSLAAVVESVGVCLFAVGTGQLVWQNTDQPTDELYQGLAFAPDGRAIAAATTFKQPMRLLDAVTGREIRRFTGEHNAAPPLVFSRDGKRLFSGGWGGRGIIWDVATGKPVGSLEPPLSTSCCLTLSPDGKILAEAGNRAIRFWDAATGKGIPGSDGAQALISSLAVSPDGKSVLTASHFDTDAGPRLWDLGTGRQRAASVGLECPVAAFAPDGKIFVAGCFHGTPVLADAATGKKLLTFEGAPGWVDSLVFTPDGKRVIGTAWGDGPIRVWDPATGKELAALGRLTQGGGAKCLALAPDGKLLATGGMDKVIRLWDIAAHKEVGRLTGQEGSLWALAFSPDGREIAGVTATGKFNFVANGTDPAIRVWDVATGRIVRTLKGPAAGSWSVAWSPDGRVLATGGEDGVIRLWELMTGRERARLTGHEGPVSALAFTPSGARLISGSSDTTALVWDVVGLGRPSRPQAADELPALWADLAGDDAARAFHAVAALAAAPDHAVPLLNEKLRPAIAPEPKRLTRLVAELDNDDFGVRERATRELEGVTELAAPALHAALEKNPSAELRRRAERLLERLTETPRDQWPALRAIEVLERAGTPQARHVLEGLAEGAPKARLTREAKASLERLARRPAPAP